MLRLLPDFRAFLMQGNLIALAVAFVIGTAFAVLVNALVVDLITPIVAAIFGEPSFGGLSFTINGAEFLYGDFLNALITFVSVAMAVFFFVLKPAQRVGLILPAPETKDCPHCTTSIPAAATRCPQCTVELPATAR
jgi:large conductance mechanosensitive channel